MLCLLIFCEKLLDREKGELLKRSSPVKIHFNTDLRLRKKVWFVRRVGLRSRSDG